MSRLDAIKRCKAPLIIAVVMFLVAGSAVACGDGKTRITVNTFGDFGYGELYPEFEKAHPNVKIVERKTDFATHHQNLQTHLNTKKGTADVEAVETGYIASIVSQGGQFVDLHQHDVKDEQWLQWKSAQATTLDGRLIGAGTDIGGLAMCYRKDLLEQANLPTDPQELADLWSTWDDYVALGKEFQASAPKGVYWFDNAVNTDSAIMGQAKVAYYDKNNNVVAKTNPEVKDAYDLVTKEAVKAGESARLPGWSQQWGAGFNKGTFATIPCPAWMLDTIEGYAPDTVKAGKWAVTTVPGGGGNWGGSFLTVPQKGEHVPLAVELVKFLTTPQAQQSVFEKHGHLPSTVDALNSKSVLNKVDARYNDAPVGQLYASSAMQLEPQYMGPKHSQIAAYIGEAIARVEQGKETPDQAWQHAMNDIDKLQRQPAENTDGGLNPLLVGFAVLVLLVVLGLVVFFFVRRRKQRSAREDVHNIHH